MNPKLRPGESGEIEVGRLFPGGRVDRPPQMTAEKRERIKPWLEVQALLGKLEHRALADKGHAYGASVTRFEGKLEALAEAQREVTATIARIRKEP